MNQYPFRATGGTSLGQALIVCMVMAICSPLAALAADRTVLGEEFTNIW